MNWKVVRWIDIFIGIPLAYLVFFLKRISQHDNYDIKSEYKRILLIKFWGIGNIVLLLPAAQALKEKYPDAEIDFLTLFSNIEVAKTTNIFKCIYSIDTNNILKFIITSSKNFRTLKDKNYDLIIDFEQFARFSAIFCSLIGKKETIGFNTKGQHRHLLYSNSVVYNNVIHIAKSFYKLAEYAGVVNRNYIKAVPIVCEQSDINEVNDMLGKWGVFDRDIFVILHVGTSENFKLRRWPCEYFGDLADRLIDNFGVKIVFTSLADKAFIKEVDILNADYSSFYIIAKYSEVKPYYGSMSLIIDDKVVDKKLIGSSFIYVYKIDGPMKQGRHKISILLEKGKYKINQNRELFIKNIFLRQK